DPFASVIGPVADIVELSREVPGASLDKAGGMIVTALANNLVNKTYLAGLSNVAQALQDPGRYGSKLANTPVDSRVPAGVAQLARTGDPVLRDARGLLDSLRARIPGMSQDLAPRRTLFGAPITREGALGPDMVSPIAVSTAKNDPVMNEMTRLG